MTRTLGLTAGGPIGDLDFLLVDDRDRSLSVTRTGAFLPYWCELDPTTDVLSVGCGDQACLAERPQAGGADLKVGSAVLR